MNKKLVVLALFCPSMVFAQTGNRYSGEVESWTVPQLCEARDSSEALNELASRDVFSKREFKAIKDGKIRGGINSDVLRCLVGEPESVSALPNWSGGPPIEAYVFQVYAGETLIVHLSNDKVRKVRILLSESEAPGIPADYNAYYPDGYCRAAPSMGCHRIGWQSATLRWY